MDKETSLYKVEQVNNHLFRIIGLTNEFAYLLIGDKQALLIDTCCGVGNIREVVDSLTNLPYEVVLTHGHVDHVGGASLFMDKKIYLNKLDWKMAKTQMKRWMRDFYVTCSLKFANAPKKPANLTYVQYKNPLFIELKEGQELDLGGLHVKAFHLGGHTPGIMTLLIEEDRLLLTGDACNPSVFLFLPGSTSVEQYRNNLKAYIPKVEGKYDKIILSHLPKECAVSFLVEMLSLCDELLAGKKNEDSFSMGPLKTKVAKKFNRSTGFTEPVGPNIFYKKLKS
jgi:hydroxyacylglutathione hydrolase